ncbi:MAG: HlyD family secretion protein [Alphaproteobacteria bacterium]|nr:HlyD family secretion protein [Alphaproteobacteria bacterium]
MSDADSIPAQGNAEVDPRAGRESFLRRYRWPLMIAGPALILLIVAYFVITGGRYQATDDAYVQIAKDPVAPSIGGRVTDIYVTDNQFVHKGQLLFRLDSRDFQANAAAAQAQLANAMLQLQAQRAAYHQQAANVQAAQDAVSYADQEAARQRKMVAAGVASQQQLDQAVNAQRQAHAQLAAAQQAQAQALAAIGGNADTSPDAYPPVMQARANLQRAQLNVAYTEVYAPADGIVTRVDQMPVGTYLNASQTGFWLLSGQPWIEANFKEDQLKKMRIGQPVDISIDAYPGTLHGHVASFSPGTGQAFSPLPAQNATGNWVKVVQRLPVRIEFDRPPPGMAARAGLSVNVKVDVRAPGRAG